MSTLATTFLLSVLALAESPSTAKPLPGFRTSAWFDEQVREEWIAEGVRVVATVPGNFDAKKPTRLVIYATPNGNTIEQTLGCAAVDGLDWHFDIQHVAAQIRKLREVDPDVNIVLACVEADGLSWPAWKRKYNDGPARIQKVVDFLHSWIPGDKIRVSLTGHSGGGSFLFGFIDSADAIPNDIDSIVFLDANYSYSDKDKHGDKLLAWLKADEKHRLTVVAYDDRNIMLNGKPVIGPDGGTFRATDRMRTRFAKDCKFDEEALDDFKIASALGRRAIFAVHANPKNRILHTALVGEMNGLLYGLSKADWGKFGGPRAYTKWIQPAPTIPKRPVDARGGAEFVKSLEKQSASEREHAIVQEISRGNMPEFLRTFQKVELRGKDAKGKERVVVFEVMPDYLAIGNDADFVRMPMTPQTAARIADVFGCALPTRKIVDDVYRAATVKLEPKPMTVDRESIATFFKHNTIIEEQRAGKKLGELVAGIKKDVVVTNRLAERPNRVAIYGWHKLDGKPIQPLTIVHVDWYVDYSHGVRLMKRTVTVDGKPMDIRHVLYSAELHMLLSDEGPIRRPAY